jgi:hypothetical protein
MPWDFFSAAVASSNGTTALELADRLQASVLIVRAWSMATAPRPPDWGFGYVPSFDEMSAAVHDHLVNDTATDVARFSHLPVQHRAAHASPAKSLVELSSEALMLVVGSRGSVDSPDWCSAR